MVALKKCNLLPKKQALIELGQQKNKEKLCLLEVGIQKYKQKKPETGRSLRGYIKMYLCHICNLCRSKKLGDHYQVL